MGQKVHPTVFRTGVIFGWKSRWYNRKKYREYLEEDMNIREFLLKKLAKMGVESIDIERSTNSVKIIIKTSRPGLLIGRGGSGIEQLKAGLQKFVEKFRRNSLVKQGLQVEVEEVKQPESRASLVAQSIAEQLERRLPYRRTMKQALERVMQSQDAQGAKIMVKGRLGGAEIARSEKLSKGKIPLQTLRANIDYGVATAYTTYGTVGIKVWIYKGEIFE